MKREELTEMLGEFRTIAYDKGQYELASLMSTLKYAVQTLED